jgi:hypothetical protein
VSAATLHPPGSGSIVALLLLKAVEEHCSEALNRPKIQGGALQ